MGCILVGYCGYGWERGGEGYFYVFTILHVSEHSEQIFFHFLMGKIYYFHGWGEHPRPIRKKFCKDT